MEKQTGIHLVKQKNTMYAILQFNKPNILKKRYELDFWQLKKSGSFAYIPTKKIALVFEAMEKAAVKKPETASLDWLAFVRRFLFYRKHHKQRRDKHMTAFDSVARSVGARLHGQAIERLFRRLFRNAASFCDSVKRYEQVEVVCGHFVQCEINFQVCFFAQRFQYDTDIPLSLERFGIAVLVA